MTVQAFPVRFAETVNRFGSTRVERSHLDDRDGALARVTVGATSFIARTHGERVTRRGRQTLVSLHGRLSWVSSSRVERLSGDEGAGEP